MTEEKFKSEVQTLKKFGTLYCKDKHSEQKKRVLELKYKTLNYEVEFELCEECQKLVDYSIHRLLECPHEAKPRCRKCPHACYEKPQWKKLAKVMRYSSIRFEVQKITNFFMMK